MLQCIERPEGWTADSAPKAAAVDDARLCSGIGNGTHAPYHRRGEIGGVGIHPCPTEDGNPLHLK